MRGVSPTSQLFQGDQQLHYVLQYWDSPFSVISAGAGTKASPGMRLDVREPFKDGTWTLPSLIRDPNNPTADTTLTNNFLGTAASSAVITNGRSANVIGYWAAGAPGHHGASKYRRVAYRFRGKFVAGADRTWFDSTTSAVSLQFGVAGSGYVRLRKGGTTFYQGALTEEGFTSDGMSWATPTSWNSDDELEVFYVQNDDPWGGFVVKVRPTSDDHGDMTAANTTRLTKRWATQEAVVVGCGLFYEGSTLISPVSIPMVQNIDIEQRPGQSSKLSFSLPLISAVGDGVGWKYITTQTDSLGYMQGTTVSGTTVTLYRNRLIRCQLGFKNWDSSDDLWPVFTGYIEDFSDASSGVVKVTASGFEQRLADQFVKNYPDPISYMTYGFRRKSGTMEPVYPIAAYDNWPMELAMRDLLVRCGVDESRLAAPLKVPQANGTMVPVTI